MALLPLIFSILTLSADASYSRSTVAENPSFTGVWKGDSVCQIKDSPCHDEASVYYVAPGSETKTFQMKMNKGSLHGNMQYHGKLYRKIYLVRQDKTAD